MTDRQGSRRRIAAVVTTTVLISTGAAFTATLSPASAAPVTPVTADISDFLSADGKQLLAASFDQQDSTVARGEQFNVSGRISTVSGDEIATLDDGVPASFTLEVIDPSGAVLATQDVTAGEQGSFDTTVPGSVTEGLPRSAEETVLAVRAVDAAYEDYAAADAGAQAVRVAAADDGLKIQNSFSSAVGWVKPGDKYPSRIILTNPATTAVNDVVVTIGAPRGTDFIGARAGAGTARRTADTVTWTVPKVPAATEADGPSTTTLILEHQADTLAEEPTLVWRDLSTRAKLVSATGNQTVVSHGPHVIPQGEQYDTARFGDRPFPVVPVDYIDRKHQADHTGEMLSDKINSRELIGSTFNLFQEMSLGQLFPEGTVPSAGIATAGFDYEPGFPFTQVQPNGVCRGASFGDGAGTPLYSERIAEGFYQLPGNTEYYGSDKFGSALPGAIVPGAAVLADIDSACGPPGKLVADSAAIADPEIDYSDYDTDKDGLVDFFMVVFAGCGGNGSSQLSVAGCPYGGQDAVPYDNVWPHSSSLEFYYETDNGQPGFETDDQLKNDEGQKLFYTTDKRNDMTTEETEWPVMVRVGPYNVNPETAIDKASVISHEYGHSLGLPDFYSLGDRETYGDWNLMATDKSQNMDIFSRVEMGWVVPEVLNGDRQVDEFTDSKQDTNEIHWRTKDGTPYTLSGPRVHNSLAFLAKLPGRQLIDPAKFDTGDKASKSHAWWSGSGNDFGCAPDAGHNLDFVFNPQELKALPEGSTIQLDLKSAFDIEWDYDYGFVLTSADGGKTFTSHASERDTPTTTPAATNPNQNGCQTKYGNGITGSSASYTDPVTVQIDRTTGNYPDYIFIADQFDISDLAGAEQPVLRFSYATDPGLARPGWFVDDLKVTATTPDGEKVLLETDFEGEGGPDDPRVLNGGCNDDFGTQCTKGWNFVDASSEAPADHAYLMEMRDRSGFDKEGNGENDREAINFLPGLSLVYTDEAHGYGNVGTDNPPAQSPLDSQPEPGSDQPDLSDAAWTAAAGDNTFTDSGEGHTDNYTDPSNSETDSRYADVGNPWRFRYNCLTFDVLSMSGEDIGPDVANGNLAGAVKFDMGQGCGLFDYGYTAEKPPPPAANTPPTASADAAPKTAPTGEEITFSGAGSTDKESPDQLDYSWDFDDGGSQKDASGVEAKQSFDTPGRYDVELTVTDADGLTAVDTVTVRITGEGNAKPQAEASSSRKSAKVGNPFKLSSDGSTDAESPEDLEYSWNFGDGGDAVDSTEENPNVTYSKAGKYTITLTVTDAGGESDTDQIRVWARDHVACESSRVGKTGGWTLQDDKDAANGQYCYAAGRATMSLNFTGPRLKLHWGQARNGGSALVTIDGKTVGTLDFSSSSRRPTFNSDRAFGRLGEGKHTVKIVVRDGAGYMDKMVLDR
jgi:immune inhibitor A